jgi:hypothetical protein
MSLSSTGSRSAPGLSNYGLGVKGTPNSGNGSPCSQVDPTETLTLRPGTTLGGRLFDKVQLDLEMTGNAVAVVTFSNGTSTETYQLLTGTSITPEQLAETDNDFTPPYVVSSRPGDTSDACAAPNSSGPNSFGNDNCEWRIDPAIAFDAVTITVLVGTVTLEGGGDFANDPSHDSLFFLTNAAPVAVTDTVAVNEDTSVTFDVVANDTDADGDSLSVASFTSVAPAQLVAVGTRSFTYTPSPEYSGPDSFTYVVTDGSGTSQATVNISVAPVNDRPVAVSGVASTDEDTTSAPIVVATDIDSTVLSATCTSTGGPGATVTDLGDGQISFTPAPNFNGAVTIECDVADDQGAHTLTHAIVNVTVNPVNDAPVAVDDVASIDQEQFVVIPVLANDTDIDGDPLTVTSLVQPSNGTVTIVPGGIRYQPTSGFSGNDSFTYKANDGVAASNVARVDVAVCTVGAVTDTDGDVSGTFVPITTEHGCKQYAVDAVQADGTVLFTPSGAEQIVYRGYLSLGARPAPLGQADVPAGTFAFNLRYDPLDGTPVRPVPWCIDPQFAVNGDVTTATVPSGDSWCVASETSRGDAAGEVVTIWQVYGIDDPRFQ